ncbi:MAG: hypothetical protein C4528_07360 [Gammaproteobacteria bacterium]|nr:MAG: hypothetical protein C4528_07360 [Gammaproteobacteria bacterium]
MPNPINVNISVTQPNVTLYIMVDTFAAYTQQATIQCPNQQTLTANGNGEGKRIGFWTYPISTPGIYSFQCLIQYNDGSGFKPSQAVASGAFSTLSLNQTVVFSEDAGDSDMNDCFVTFMWFASGVTPK